MGTPSQLIECLLPKTRLKLLALLMREPFRQFYVREIIRLSGIGQGIVQRELASLSRVGILLRRTLGNRTYFQANTGCPIYPELHALMLKTAGLIDVLADALKPLAEGIALALVYGSFARGEEREGSDVDIAVIGTASFREVVTRLRKAQTVLAREINPTVFSRAEFQRRARQKERFVTELLRAPKLFVMGSEDELRRMVS